MTFAFWTDQPIKMRFFVEIKLFIVLASVNCILLRYTKIPPEHLIRHTFLKNGLSKSNQTKSTKLQKIGTKRHAETWNRFVPSKPTIFFLVVVFTDIFAQVKIIFLIRHLTSTINFSFLNLPKNEAI